MTQSGTNGEINSSYFAVGGSLCNSPRIVYYKGHTYDLDESSFCLPETQEEAEGGISDERQVREPSRCTATDKF